MTRVSATAALAKVMASARVRAHEGMMLLLGVQGYMKSEYFCDTKYLK